MEKWHIQNPKLLENIKTSLLEHFPDLKVFIENEVVFIRGDLSLPESVDKFSIEIEFKDDYPDSVPVVKEIGGRIPHGERHTFTNGNCCLFVREEKWKHYPKGTKLIDFINNVVIPYFLAQTYFEITGQWLWGERGHGIYGILEFYEEELKTNDIKLIVRFIEYLAKPTLKKYRICYCGSMKKLQNCHYQTLKIYRERISPETAKDSLIMLFSELKRIENLPVAGQHAPNQNLSRQDIIST